MAKILGEHCHLSCPIESIKKKASADKTNWELFTKDSKSVGSFDDVVFACYTPTTHSILEQESEVDSNLLDALKKIEYGDNVVYLHSDPKLMPKSKNAWASWNCMGRSSLISSAYAAKKIII